MPGLLIDLDGVIYDGDRAIDGAAGVLDWIDAQHIPRLFLTNTTSRPRSALVEKLAGIGIAVRESDLFTPPVAAARWLRENVTGKAALFAPDAIKDEFPSIEFTAPGSTEPVAAVVIGDYAERWSFAELNRAFRLLMQEPAPSLVALGMTRYWRAPSGLQLDTGPFATALCHAAGVEPVVLGKPAAPFFAAALAELATNGDAIMVGDDIQTDVAAAQRSGVRGILVKTGKFRPTDLDAGVRPDAVLESIAGLPRWWRDAVSA